MQPLAMIKGESLGVMPFSFEGQAGRKINLHYYRARNYSPGGNVVFVLHGMLRNGDEYRDFWIDAADAHDLLIVAPTFPNAGFSDPINYNNGMVKTADERTTARSSWTYNVPAKVVEMLTEEGIMTQGTARIFGHSAGGQFLHRMVSLVGFGPFREVIAANSGWYSLPTLEQDFPAGLGGTGLDQTALTDLLQTELWILAGQRDCEKTAENLPMGPEAEAQGAGRLQRARTYYESGKAAAAALGVPFGWKLTEVPDVDHDGNAMGRAAAGLWFDGKLPSADVLGSGRGVINA